MSDYEMEMVARLGWPAVSSELVAPVIVAAHMGLRVAAVVVTV
jgi:purine nucleoside phosphorylase